MLLQQKLYSNPSKQLSFENGWSNASIIAWAPLSENTYSHLPWVWSRFDFLEDCLSTHYFWHRTRSYDIRRILYNIFFSHESHPENRYHTTHAARFLPEEPCCPFHIRCRRSPHRCQDPSVVSATDQIPLNAFPYCTQATLILPCPLAQILQHPIFFPPFHHGEWLPFYSHTLSRTAECTMSYLRYS